MAHKCSSRINFRIMSVLWNKKVRFSSSSGLLSSSLHCCALRSPGMPIYKSQGSTCGPKMEWNHNSVVLYHSRFLLQKKRDLGWKSRLAHSIAKQQSTVVLREQYDNFTVNRKMTKCTSVVQNHNWNVV